MKEDTLVIHEIYASIQGESTFAGLPCTFVRTTGCNLRCSWCDTTQAFYGGTRMARAEVLARALATETPLVELTGGEPLLQPGSFPLLAELCDAGRTVLVETSGEADVSRVDPRVHKIMDLKAPGSGETHRMEWRNLDLLKPTDEAKAVILDRRDYEWARDLVRQRALAERCTVLFSPVHGQLDPGQLARWVLDDGLPVRVQVQMHKYLWPGVERGV